MRKAKAKGQTMTQTMQVAKITAYGGPQVVQLHTAPMPSPGPSEVLVRVHAAPVTAGDVRIRSGNVPRGMGLPFRAVMGWRRPRVGAGMCFSGEIAGLGQGVTQCTLGQRVFGMTGLRGGAHAEYITLRAGGLILPLPETLSHAEGAAFFFGGLTAAEFLIDKAKMRAGEAVLVAGATGAVGSAAVQIAAHLGAKVTATASAQNIDLARGLGAAHALDYRAAPPSGPFDVIIDVMSSLLWQGAAPMLSPKGRLCLITASLTDTLGAVLRPHRGGRRVIAGTIAESRAQMQRLIDLHRAGGYRPLLGEVLPFAQIARAHALADGFHKRGNLVVQMAD